MAREADKKVLEPYFTHPSHYIIDNLGKPSGFKTKLQRCLDALKQIVGFPYKPDYKKIFLLEECNKLIRLFDLYKVIRIM
jgi:hypothetical protein